MLIKFIKHLPKRGIAIVALVIILSCKKSNENRTCWDCEVIRMDGSKYNERVCRDDGLYPDFTDGNGNDLNAFCTKR